MTQCLTWPGGLTVVLAVLFLGNAAECAPLSAPRIPGYERFHSRPGGALASGGHLLISELNCRSCHRGDCIGDRPVADKSAPILDQVGGRVRPEWIREFLTHPHVVKPGTTMPDILGGLPLSQREQTVEALTHFLASTGSVRDTYSDAAAARRGQALFQRIGCAACHDSQSVGDRPLATSAPLPQLDRKYTLDSLAAFLKDPLKVRPSGRMPALGLTDGESREIAQHFLQGRPLTANVKFAVYEGTWEKLPDFSQMKPVKTGTAAGFDLGVAGKTRDFGIRFETNLFLQTAGKYQFTLGSDDGSRLTIDGRTIVDVDGIHPHQDKKVGEPFEAGWHQVQIDYFQGGGEWTLTADLEGNGLSRRPIASLSALSTDRPPSEQGTEAFVINPDLAQKGRELFSALGCASCHSMTVDGQKLESRKFGAPWAALKQNGGCVAVEPAPGLPNYKLSDEQVEAIRAAMKTPSADGQPAGIIATTLLTLNCYACHLRGEVGGVEESRNSRFTSSQQEMGDEGRIPPTLTGVGDKLQEAWLKHVLDRGANDRQFYMQTRMPRFGGGNVGHLAAAFVKLDRRPESLPKVEFSEPDYRVIADGRHLVGGKALSCIKCHDFAKYPSQGVRAISLTTMTKRLREDWFYRYVLNPQEFRAGTRMPAPWPFGQATVRDILNADTEQQMVAVWRYLAEGERASLPVGLIREPIELIAQDRPILYRNFIEGAGSRAIGVGYPQKVNLAWDANEMRLAMIWHGAFIDASRHWNARGVGFEPPLGDHILHLAPGRPLATLASMNDSWPEGMARDNGFQFQGYSLADQGQPEFRFTWGELRVSDAFTPHREDGARDSHLQRTLTFSGTAPAASYCRLLTGRKISATDTADVWLVDDLWQIKVTGPTAAEVRALKDRQELLIPVDSQRRESVYQIDYRW